MKFELTLRSESIEDEFKIELALRSNDMRLALHNILKKTLETTDNDLKQEVNQIINMLDLRHIVEYDYT